MGTPAYMSPEQVRREPLDTRTDLFSFGAVLCEMATGRQPFEGCSAALIQDAILNHTPQLQLNPDLPAGFQSIINKALEKDREQRYQFASEIRADLRRLKQEADSGGGRQGADVADLHRASASAWAHRSRWLVSLSASLVLMAMVSSGIWWRHRQRIDPVVLRERPLTSNSSEIPVTAAAISTDGRRLAYASNDGVFLKDVDTGESHRIPSPKHLSFFALAWFPEGTKLLANGSSSGSLPGLWVISILEGTVRRLRDDVCSAALSPDGSRIAITTCKAQEILVIGAGGEDPQRLTVATGKDFLAVRGWSPDGQGIVYARGFHGSNRELTLEFHDLRGNRPRVLLSDPRLEGFGPGVFLADGRYLYSRMTDPDHNDYHRNLWEIRVDSRTGQVKSEPRQITHWTDFFVSSLSASADGRRLAFVKESTQVDVYIGSLEGNGKSLKDARRLTFDDRDDFPAGWMPDSKAVLFSSDRNGNFDIFKQAIDQRTVEALLASPKDECDPLVTPDGRWLLYFSLPTWKRQASSEPVELRRVPLSGGLSEVVLREPCLSLVRCSGPQANRCVVDHRDQRELSFYSFDVIRGKDRLLARIDVQPPPGEFSWTLSSDGSYIAVVMDALSENAIRVLSLETGVVQTVHVKGWNRFQSISWASDGGWLVSSHPIPDPSLSSSPSWFVVRATDPMATVAGPINAESAMLLHVDPNGNAQVLGPGDFSILSPDGSKLAFPKETTVANAWMIEGF